MGHPPVLDVKNHPEGKTHDVTRFTNDEPETRDDSHDPYRFESPTGFFAFNSKDEQNGTELSVHNGDSTFGLLCDDWSSFKAKIAELQESAPANVTYKVLFCGRHGQGWHNIGNESYDQVTWDFDYARRNGNDEITWGPDAELTAVGEGQARDLNAGWKANLGRGCPQPTKWFVSPLTRTTDTMRISFGDILDGETPMFVEKFREIYGEQTCDKRRSKSFLQERFPTYAFEEGFAEEDPWWTPDERELEVDRRVRIREALYKVFDDNEDTYISITSHACALKSLMAVLKHKVFKLGTGGMVPIVVKATKP